jgi:bifunctional non-homologous end joining protein LigD
MRQGDRPQPKRKAGGKGRKKAAARKGTSRKSARKKGLSAASSLPNFIPFVTCLLVDRPPNGPDWVHEIKLDGWRVQARVEDGTPTIRTWNGHDYSSTFPEIASAARGLDNCIIDGEACAIDKYGVTNFRPPGSDEERQDGQADPLRIRPVVAAR